MTTAPAPMDASPDRRAALDRSLHDIAWGLLLTLTGAVWLVPSDRVPHGAWLFGVAAILLGVNAVRYFSHLDVNRFSSFLGVLALLAALGQFWRADLPLLAICLVAIGLSLIAKRLFGHTT